MPANGRQDLIHHLKVKYCDDEQIPAIRFTWVNTYMTHFPSPTFNKFVKKKKSH